MFLYVKVTPNAKLEVTKSVAADRLHISVREKAEAGKATARARTLVARYLALPISRVQLVSGASKPNKIFKIKQ